jgi:hypothetical protein
MNTGAIGKAPVKACAGDSRSAIGQCWSVDFDVHTQQRSGTPPVPSRHRPTGRLCAVRDEYES